jgi:hypothetical protein
MRNLLTAVFICLLATHANIRTVNSQTVCPPCLRNRGPLPSDQRAHQLPPMAGCDCATANCPGCPGDNRLVYEIAFDATADSTWITGWDANGAIVNPTVYHAVRCARDQWNTRRGTNGEGIPYFLVINQDSASPEILISQRPPPSGARFADTSFFPPTPESI